MMNCLLKTWSKKATGNKRQRREIDGGSKSTAWKVDKWKVDHNEAQLEMMPLFLSNIAQTQGLPATMDSNARSTMRNPLASCI